MAALILVVVWPATALTAENRSGGLVVLSAESANYRALADGFARGIASPVRSLLATSPAATEEIRSELGKVRVALAVGPEAARALLAERPAIPLLLASAGADQGSSDPKVLVVPVAVPPSSQVATLKRMLPTVLDVPRQPRLGVLFDPRFSSKLVEEYEAAASLAGFSLVKAEVHGRAEIAGAARDLLARVQALWLLPDPTVVNAESFRTLMHLSIANRVPMVGYTEAMAKAGSVLAIQPNYAEIGRNAGQAAKRMADGAPPALKQPDGLVFLNAKAAQLLEIELTEAARGSAVKVFE